MRRLKMLTRKSPLSILPYLLSAILPGVLLSVLFGSAALAYESKTQIQREVSDGYTPWIMEICVDEAADAGTAQEVYVELSYRDANGSSQRADGQVAQKGISNYYSSYDPASDSFTYALGNAYDSSDFGSMIQPGQTYLMVFRVPSSITRIDEISIQVNTPRKTAYDNLKINYIKVFRHSSGTIGDLCQDTGGSYYRPLQIRDRYALCTSIPGSLAGSDNPGRVTIPLSQMDHTQMTSDLTYTSQNYILRLSTKEQGDFDGNVRFYFYTKGIMGFEEFIGMVDLKEAAQAQGKPAWSHDLYGNSILDIPFRGKRYAGRTIVNGYYNNDITRIVVEPIGDAGTGWLPDSIILFAEEPWERPSQDNTALPISAKGFSRSTANQYQVPSGRSMIAHWQNDSNVGFSSGDHIELSSGGDARPDCVLTRRVYNPNHLVSFSPSQTTFYLSFQTRDSVDASLSLIARMGWLNSLHMFTPHARILSEGPGNEIYVDVTYRTNASSQYQDLVFRPSTDDAPDYPSVRTMRFYLIEGTWKTLNEKGIDNSSFLAEVFDKGQTDYLPVTLLDMATGTADDIVSVRLSCDNPDVAWQLQSLAVYAAEPEIANHDEISKWADIKNSGLIQNWSFPQHQDTLISFHPDIRFQEYPKLYYAPADGFRFTGGTDLVLSAGERQQLAKPDDNLKGYLNDGTSLYHPYEPCINYGSTYLFVINPSRLASTMTAKDMQITVNYLDTQDVEQSTSCLLSDALEAYYGRDSRHYVPQDMGREISFLLEIKNVKTFLSTVITMQDFTSPSDQFQLDSISIYKVKDVDNQVHYMLYSSNLASTRLQFLERYVDRGDCMASISKTTYFAPGAGSKLLNFIDYSSGRPVEQDPNTSQGLTSIKKEMAYQEINKDLRLATVRSTYEIQVNVSPMADAGSTNYFFFQLLFENGTSGVVLANEQIAGDAFRQGETASFTIMTNQYYGQPKGIRIYTHSSNTEDATAFDKLNIDSIDIIRQSGIGLSTSWRIEKVGWIDINYTEDDVSGLTTRMNTGSGSETASASVCREYYVTKNTAAMDFMVEFDVHHTTATVDPNLTATVYYRKTTGAGASINLNVNERVNEYNGTAGAAYLAGYPSRFYMSLNDVAEITQIRFQSDQASDFILQNLRVYRVAEKGDVYLDSTGRYNRHSKLTPVTYGAMDVLKVVNSQTGDAVINLAANQNMEISFRTDSDGTTSFTSGATSQTSVRESLNIYVFPGYNDSFRTNLRGSLRYTGTYSSGFMQQALTFDRASRMENGALAIRGLELSNLGAISSLTLSSDDNTNPSVSHVIVERVNHGRKVKSYYIDFQDAALISPVRAMVSTEDNPDEMMQKVTVTTSQVDPVRLSATNNIGVAIRYRSSIDSSVEYVSDYVFLWEQSQSRFSKGDPITATLQESNVGEITGVSIICTGNISLTTDTVYACCYDKYDDLLYATGIGTPLSITPEDGSINSAVFHDTVLRADVTVMPVIFTMKTAKDTTAIPVTGTHSAVYATLVCLDPSNSERTVEIPLGNIRHYFSGSNADHTDIFQSDRTDVFTAYLYHTGEPLELRLSMSGGDNDPWTLSEVSVKRRLPDGTYETRSGGGGILSAAEDLVIDLRAIDAEEQIKLQLPTVSGNDGGSGTSTGNTSTAADNNGNGMDNDRSDKDNNTNGMDNSTNDMDNSTNSMNNSTNGMDNSTNSMDNSTNGMDNNMDTGN